MGFAAEVFGGMPEVQLTPDLDCADIYVFYLYLPVNSGAVLIYVDTDAYPVALMKDALASYPGAIIVGPTPAGGASLHFEVPYASTSFSVRSPLLGGPAVLRLPRAERVARALMAAKSWQKGGEPPSPPERLGLVAYIAHSCFPHRENFFRYLVRAVAAAGEIGPVDAISRCGRNVTLAHAEDQDASPNTRFTIGYMDEAASTFARYRFAMVFENTDWPNYVTEKIVNAFLGGAVPIYWGTNAVLKWFNPASFIYVNKFASFKAAAQHVITVAKDPAAYAAYADAPVLRDGGGAELWPFSWHTKAPTLPANVPTLRSELVSASFQRAGVGITSTGSVWGNVHPSERRVWDFAGI